MLTLDRRLHWARRVCEAQIIFACGLFLFAYASLVIDTAFFQGVQDAFAEAMGQPAFTAEQLGRMSAPLFVHAAVAGVVIHAIRRRTKLWGMAAYGLLMVQVFGAFAVGGVAAFGLIALLLLARKDVVAYLGASSSHLPDTSGKVIKS